LKGETKEINAQFIEKNNSKTAYISRTNAKLVEVIDKIKKEFALTRTPDDIFRSALWGEVVIDYLEGVNENSFYTLPKYVRLIVEQALESDCQTKEDVVEYLMDKDMELAMGIYIASKYDVERLYNKAKKLYNKNSDTVLTTAHSSKGLEFKKVIITDDFPNLLDYIGKYVNENIDTKRFNAKTFIKKIRKHNEELSEIIDEMNLQYVAITRAIRKISGKGFRKIKRNFSRPLSEKDIMQAVEEYKVENLTGFDSDTT
jgi:F-box protein 18 (helicase)